MTGFTYDPDTGATTPTTGNEAYEVQQTPEFSVDAEQINQGFQDLPMYFNADSTGGAPDDWAGFGLAGEEAAAQQSGKGDPNTLMKAADAVGGWFKDLLKSPKIGEIIAGGIASLAAGKRADKAMQMKQEELNLLKRKQDNTEKLQNSAAGLKLGMKTKKQAPGGMIYDQLRTRG